MKQPVGTDHCYRVRKAVTMQWGWDERTSSMLDQWRITNAATRLSFCFLVEMKSYCWVGNSATTPSNDPQFRRDLTRT